MEIRSGLRAGILAGLIDIFIVLLGLQVLVGTIVQGWFDLPSQGLGAWLLLLAVAFGFGVSAARGAQERAPRHVLAVGLVTGASQGLIMALFVLVISSLTNAGVELSEWLVQLTPEAIELLTFGLPPVAAALVVFVLLTVAALAGAVLVLASKRFRWRESARRTRGKAVGKVESVSAVQHFREYKYARQVLYGIAIVALLIGYSLGRSGRR